MSGYTAQDAVADLIAATADALRAEVELLATKWTGGSALAAAGRIADLARELADAKQPAPETPPKEPCPEGFHYIGQDISHCDQCGLPIWEHAGVAELPEGAWPFDSSRPMVLRPFQPGEADRIRARWEASHG